MRPVNTGAAEDYVGHWAGGQQHLRLELGGAVAGVGVRYVGRREGGVAPLVTLAHHGERTHVEEAFRNHVGSLQSLGEVAQNVVVDVGEFSERQGFSGTEIIYYVIPLLPLGQSRAESVAHGCGVIEVENYEFQALIIEKYSRRGGSHAGPHLPSAPEAFLGKEAAGESSGTCYQYFFHKSVISTAQASMLRFSVEKLMPARIMRRPRASLWASYSRACIWSTASRALLSRFSSKM